MKETVKREAETEYGKGYIVDGVVSQLLVFSRSQAQSPKEKDGHLKFATTWELRRALNDWQRLLLWAEVAESQWAADAMESQALCHSPEPTPLPPGGEDITRAVAYDEEVNF